MTAPNGPDEAFGDTRRTFHHQLDEIRSDLVRLGGMVINGLPQATEMLLDTDLRATQDLIDADDALDALAFDIEDRCFQLFALQQPMATDLRVLITATRLTGELERSGDLVVNIVKGARRIFGIELDPRTRGMIARLSEEAARLFSVAMDAFADRDDATAAALDDMDDQLDELHRAYIAHLLEACRAGDLDVQAAVQLALVGRYYERIGDHAVNVGERTRFMVSGWLPARPPKPRGFDAEPQHNNGGS